MRIFLKMFIRKKAPLVGLLVLLLPVCGYGAPTNQSGQSRNVSLLSANRYVSLNQAVSMVQRRTGGRILSASTRQDNGITYYLIKVLTPKGVVRVYRVDTQGHFR